MTEGRNGTEIQFRETGNMQDVQIMIRVWTEQWDYRKQWIFENGKILASCTNIKRHERDGQQRKAADQNVIQVRPLHTNLKSRQIKKQDNRGVKPDAGQIIVMEKCICNLYNASKRMVNTS